MDDKHGRSRFGVFSHPLPLTVGDDSTNYQKPSKFQSQINWKGRERSEVGRLRQITNNPSRGTMDTFEKLKSNAIGDTYVDPGQYILRKSYDPKNGNTRPQTSSGVFRPSGSNKTIRKSEFEHKHNGPPVRPEPEKRKNFLTRFTYEVFQKKTPYTEDLYENKEDTKRKDYITERGKILEPQRPYTSTVKQRGTFYNTKTTFGLDRDFPEVSSSLNITRSVESQGDEKTTLVWAFQGSRSCSHRL
jgi:hypothetical protein